MKSTAIRAILSIFFGFLEVVHFLFLLFRFVRLGLGFFAGSIYCLTISGFLTVQALLPIL